jgi:pSer/pThr/pTyr-binding forkhead associated (FHA) protein
MKMSLKLKVAGKPDGLRIPISRLPFLIGRDPLCRLRPASKLISPHHCVIWARGDQLLVRDLGSTNGTYLNNHAISGEREAHHGDRVRTGPLVFDVCIEGPPSEIQPIPVAPKQNSTGSANIEDAAAKLLLLGEEASGAPTAPVDADPAPLGETTFSLVTSPSEASPASQSDHGQQEGPSDAATIAAALLKRYQKRHRP